MGLPQRKAYLKKLRQNPHPWDGITHFPTRINNLSYHELLLLGQYYTRTELANHKCLETIKRLRHEQACREEARIYITAAKILGDLSVEILNPWHMNLPIIKAVPYGMNYPDSPPPKKRSRQKPSYFLEGIWDYL